MNLDSYLSHQKPPPQSSCRQQNASLNTKDGETQLKGQASKSTKDARRRRQKLRRNRSVPQADSDHCWKKKRDGIQKEKIEGPSPTNLTREDETVIGGSQESGRYRAYGKISVVGRRREMGDVVAIELGFLKRGEESYDFFGVYDCNGGWCVAQACGQVLHKIVAKIVEEESSQEIDWEEMMRAGFNMMEAEANKKGVAVSTILSSAVVAVVGKNEVVVANFGGSRMVLSSGGVAVELEGHEPFKGDAVERIEVCRGDAINWPVATSRALEPKVRVMRRSRADEFLILGSDGLWDSVSEELACQVARRFCDGSGVGATCCGAMAAAALMAELAVARGGRDNISIVVVDLKGNSKEMLKTQVRSAS